MSIYRDLDKIVEAVMISVASDYATDWPTEAIDAMIERHGQGPALAGTAQLVKKFADNWLKDAADAKVQEEIEHLIKDTEVPGDFESARDAIAATMRGELPTVDYSLSTTRDTISALLWIIVKL